LAVAIVEVVDEVEEEEVMMIGVGAEQPEDEDEGSTSDRWTSFFCLTFFFVSLTEQEEGVEGWIVDETAGGGSRSSSPCFMGPKS
jgi:hypothetical protein